MPVTHPAERPVETKLGSRRSRLPSVAVVSLCLFGIVVALTGGSARPDNVLLLALRPVNVVCLTAILLAGGIDWRRIGIPLVLLGLFALLHAMQLVPLPPQVWQAVSFRMHYSDVLVALDAMDLWQPLTVAPDRTWNSLVALLVPFTILVGFAALSEARRQALIWPLLGLIGMSMVLGLAQTTGGSNSPLYWYEVSNVGEPIGLFANRNHQAAFLAIGLPLLRAWALMSAPDARARQIRARIALGAGALILVYLLVLGSRSGIVLALVGLAGAFLVEPKVVSRRLSRGQGWLIPAGMIAGGLAIFAVVNFAGRNVAVERIMGNDVEADLRVAAMPTMLRIIEDSMPLGAGFGAFVPVFVSYEPDSLLKPTYFNNAHNDLVELAITGGVPALILLAGFLAWFAWVSYGNYFRPHSQSVTIGIRRAASIAALILLLASLTDYPLRTPILAAVFALLCGWMAEPTKARAAREFDETRHREPR